ncbi:MAG: division/cell wall cluster transcriptional repressor MraZ [Anaerolineae bacterium]|nr:division/cell wall cluster transcriptional repressor MraZ [Anaerolineae bacterium]
MFLGEFYCQANAQGSLTLPGRIRSGLEGELTLTRGLERCLLIYPAQEWQQLAARIQAQLCLTRSGDRAFARLMFSGALSCMPDAEGRIPMPEYLRQYAGIQGEAVIVGLYNHLEVWDAQRWAEVTVQLEARAELPSQNEAYPAI